MPLLQPDALAWGQNGHRVVGHVAQENLSRKAEKKIMALLGNNSLSEVSVWMDDIKSDARYDHTHDWHWVTIPDGQTYAQTEKNEKGDILMKIQELVVSLKGGSLNRQEEQEALKYLVHLVGDLHQPLHVGGGDDKGGNDVRVDWFGRNSNLHRVWDSEMIESKQLSFTELSHYLNKPSKAQIKAWQSSSVEAWAMESMGLRSIVYDLPENKKLGYSYMYKNWDTVETRLLQAGIRLAGLLNEIYG
ncbi:S1/P1 Nuclease [Cesiribacter andamanensis AMV16]|uniref:S1/P1 Nuclease n=2 Tax=Cesiribacter TaxID=1133570 RepID=M7NX88_9BACT|nr:S1/P1 Nuclease [Cesiribacter andamanensis AMV16]